jgi:hypothetical protein
MLKNKTTKSQKSSKQNELKHITVLGFATYVRTENEKKSVKNKKKT